MAAAVELAAYKDVLIILASTAVTVPLLKRLGISPALAFLGIGVLVGPTALGGLTGSFPWLSWVTVSDSKQIGTFAELGVVFLLFLIGLELSYERLTRMKRLVLGLGSLQVVGTAAVIAFVAWWVGQPVAAAVLVGGALALSSTAVVVEHLAEQKRLTTTSGRTTFAVLLMQDLAVIPLLFLIGALSQRQEGSVALGLAMAIGQGAIAILLVVAVGRRVLRPFLRQVSALHEPQVFMAAAILIVVGTAVVTAAFGVSMALGAFVAGLLLAETEYRRAIEATLQPFKGILLGAFFFSVGLSIDLGALVGAPMAYALAVTALIAVKIVIIVPLVRAFGLSWLVAIRSALLLGPAGEFAFVTMGQATAAGVVSAETGAFIITMTAISMATVPLLDRLGGWIADRVAVKAPPDPELQVGPPAAAGKRVIVVGYGRVGQLVCEMLARHQVPFLAVDSDPREIAHLRRQGHNVYFGDANSELFLEQCGIRDAASLVLTLHTGGALDEIAQIARALNPTLTIIARARDADHAKQLYSLGVTDAVPETIEASLQLSEAVLFDLGVPAGKVIASVHERRDIFRKELQEAGIDDARVRNAVRTAHPDAATLGQALPPPRS
ncbi:MAG: cation:proton antiporter [Phreatobacter sp.]|uniref:cation:proton antiporter domain-containing protein n=1 Tax=Phreatobacter sp. TaxID=1966341 RepID=UPI002732C6AE|nr:cation:proton antiporter [Phreatobacter sp.]MDP2803147.1 cation:proton antiporter [Phreatobacter sp.]